MRYAIVLFLALSACAKGHDLDCEHLPDAIQAVYPDGKDRKSDLFKCEDGTYRVISVDGSASFEANGYPQVRGGN